MKRPLPVPVQGTSLTDKDGKPTSHNYRWIESVGSALTDTQSAVTALDASTTNSINSINTSLGTLNTEITKKLTPGTSKTFTSATTFWDFTGIPSWAKRITFVATGLNVSGSSLSVATILQLGTSAGIENSGYSSAGLYFAFNASVGPAPGAASGLLIAMAGGGTITAIINNVTGNSWAVSGSSYVNGNPSAYACTYFSSKTIAGPLTTVRLTTTAGTANITAGTANIFYE